MDITAASIERTLRHCVENGGIIFTAYYDAVKKPLSCKIDDSWEIHGVTANDEEISFIASKNGELATKYQVCDQAYIKSAKKWFEEVSKNLKPAEKFTLTTTMPRHLVFHAGATELVTA